MVEDKEKTRHIIQADLKSEREKEEILEHARRRGYPKISDYIRALISKDMGEPDVVEEIRLRRVLSRPEVVELIKQYLQEEP